MRLGRIRGHNLRLLADMDVYPAPGINQISGGNAQGKTSLLEAIYVLGRARSFRARSLAELAGPAGKDWTLTAQRAGEEGLDDTLGVGWIGGQRQVRYNAEAVQGYAQLADLLPVQLIDPLAHRLLEDGPAYRRAYLDWGVFHVEHSFLEPWRICRRALQQRNRALRLGHDDAAVLAWDRELERAAVELTRHRSEHVARIDERLRQLLSELLGLEGVRLELYSGWPRGRGLAEVLGETLVSQRQTGVTPVGPQRAELKLKLADAGVRGGLSRGQQKLCVAAMVFAQSEVIADVQQRWPVILIDDFTAELSELYQQRLATLIRRYRGQTFITGFQPSPLLDGPATAVFHVEHGVLSGRHEH